MININSNSNLILELQNYLINLRNMHPSLPRVYETGIYDTETINAVIVFQQLMGIPSTGNVDFDTWNMIINENNEYLRRTQVPGRIPFSTPNFKEIKLGDQGDIVYALKIMLNSFSRRYTNYTQLELTNLYDEQTQEAVNLFQQRSMLPITGIVDRITWNLLVSIYECCRFYL
jgi:peptidoglycan hydrolase-like protein with peptidoglycan-binding domain